MNRLLKLKNGGKSTAVPTIFIALIIEAVLIPRSFEGQ